MSDIYIIDNTSGTELFSIQPGTLNGPGGTQRNTDLRLYGQGAIYWGEGIIENLYKLLETFACPSKEANDYNPASGQFDFNPSTQALLPKDERDLGPGKGISTPINGMLWYNMTDSQLYAYNAVNGWSSVTQIATEAPSSPTVGTLWYGTLASGNTVCGKPQMFVYDPAHVDADVDGWVSLSANYLAKCGGTMDGAINMGSNKITNLANPTVNADAANKYYVDTATTSVTGDLSAHVNDFTKHLTSPQNSFLDSLDLSSPSSLATGVNSLIGIPSGTNLIAEIDAKVARSGDTMTGVLYLQRNPTGADSGLIAATKAYVDTSIANIGTSNVAVVNPVSGAKDGDIRVSSTATSPFVKIEIRGAGAWRQVWPAQYS